MKKSKKIIAWLLTIFIVVLVFAGLISSKKNKIPSLSLSKVSSKDIQRVISLTGNLSSVSQQTINLNSAQKVAAVYVSEGDTVKKGDVILKFDTTDIEYQLNKAKINLESIKINAQSSRKQAKINLDMAQSNYDNAQNKFRINEELYNSGAISKEEYNTYQKALKDAENQLELAKMQYENTDTSSSSSTGKQIEAVKYDIDNLNKKISESTIKANINGTVVKLDAKANEYPQMGDKIIILNSSSLKVDVDVSQFDAVNIKLNQRAVIKVKGIDKSYSGRVTKIGQIAQSSGMATDTQAKVRVEISIDNADENIKSGYEADVSIILNEKKNVLAIGYEAVKEDADGKRYVYVVENNKAVKRYIKTGIETDFDIEVLEGLKLSDTYIDNPPDNIKEGMIVNTGGGK
ncbi:Multidrug efflux pump subunit AcrA (membrane-fusion protein) [Caloramator quimbayensis]|uniref:Multidrug efflux pump subunit AcrA (Membrane-fusion protein) n=1 Tax=Caloramator quimbayensis TaxID=1147123 RepID=A0A1T4WIU2_9CLOT|nr:biotin/lipoyl-binding protein [Caloramator quimbayensis]SKA76571.1 Multidrug efflux pump subunit AcrA (membrane-fusion protein) [Caloramator quimbayensis]